MPSLSKRNSNRPSPTPHIEHRLTRLKRQQLYKIPSIRGSLQRTKMPSPLIPLKRIISPMPTTLQAHPFAIPIRSKQLRLNYTISHGPSPSQQKSDSSQKKSRNQHISEKEPFQRQTAAPTKWCRSEATAIGIEPNRGPVVREPRGGQIYKVDREFRTSRRALNVLSVRVRTVRAGDLICLPPGGGAPRLVSLG